MNYITSEHLNLFKCVSRNLALIQVRRNHNTQSLPQVLHWVQIVCNLLRYWCRLWHNIFWILHCLISKTLHRNSLWKPLCPTVTFLRFSLLSEKRQNQTLISESIFLLCIAQHYTLINIPSDTFYYLFTLKILHINTSNFLVLVIRIKRTFL